MLSRKILLMGASLLSFSLGAEAQQTLMLKAGSAAVFVLKPARAVNASNDTTPPATTAGPSVSGTTDTTAILSATINEKGTGYYLVQMAVDLPPTVATMQTTGMSFAMNANVAATQNITGLTGNTAYKLYFIAKDASSNLQAAVASVAFTTLPDTTPPITTAADAVSTTDTATTLSATINEAGTGYYVVQASGGAPTVAQIMAGQNSSGAAALKSGNSVMTTNVAANMNITGLTGSTPYTIYFVAKDVAIPTNNVQAQAAVRSISFTTNADTTPPVTQTGPSVSDTTATSTKLLVTINENGTGYYLWQPAAVAAPNVAAVIAANNFFAMSAYTAATPTVSGLSASTAYKIYFVAKDASNNVQATVQSVDVTTPADQCALAASSSALNACCFSTNDVHIARGRATTNFTSVFANTSFDNLGTYATRATTSTSVKKTNAFSNTWEKVLSCP